MNSHEIDYELIGDDMQIVEVELDPGETVIAEAGAMNYMEDQISFEAKMGDGSKPHQGLFGKLLDVGKRALTGESIFMTHFTNQGMGKKRVSFAAPYPGKIICIDLNIITKVFFARRTPFYVPHWEPMYPSLFKENWGPDFSAEKVLSCKNFPGMEKHLFMRGVQLCVKNYRAKPCGWIPAALWPLRKVSITISKWRVV